MAPPSMHSRVDVLEAAFDQFPEALFICDKDLIITDVNRAAQKLLQISSAEMVGKPCVEAFQCGECDPGCGVRAGLNQSPSARQGTVRLRANGNRERLALLRTAQLFNDNGQVHGVVSTIQEVTPAAVSQKVEVIAESPAMREMLRFIRRVATSGATTLLLEGENGTGKDLIAKAIHYQSLRQAHPLVSLNCAAIPETLLESELFGYEKGAFTDARAQKKGLFELADHGTLFLDEIGELTLTLQAKLLRALEEQSFRRLGGLGDIQLNVRVIAATNCDLRQALKKGAFRQDLYFRLNVIQVVIPPLRKRREDILPLARFFVEHYNRKFKQHVEGIAEEAEHLLLAYDWPGNVRELRNAIERAMVLEESSYLTAANLPLSIRDAESAPPPAPLEIPQQELSLNESQRKLLVQALAKAGGNQAHAARLLRITRDTLRYKLKKFRLK